jgi:tetratricopeptide (TPR) repeat protein
MKRSAHLVSALLIAVLPASIGVSATAAQDPAVASLLAEGDRRYAALDNAGALRSYEQALEQAPDDFETLRRMVRTLNYHGNDLVAAGQSTEAAAVLDRGIVLGERLREHHPDEADSWFQLAVAYGNTALFRGGRDKVRIGRDVEAFSLRALAIDSTYALPHVALGIFYREVAQLNWVQRTLATALFGGLPDGSLELSEYHLRQAARLDPSRLISHFELGLTLDALGRRDEAAAQIALSMGLVPENTEERRKVALATHLLQDWGR